MVDDGKNKNSTTSSLHYQTDHNYPHPYHSAVVTVPINLNDPSVRLKDDKEGMNVMQKKSSGSKRLFFSSGGLENTAAKMPKMMVPVIYKFYWNSETPRNAQRECPN